MTTTFLPSRPNVAARETSELLVRQTVCLQAELLSIVFDRDSRLTTNLCKEICLALRSQ